MSNVTKIAVINGGVALPTRDTLIPQTNEGQQFNIQWFQRIFSGAEVGNGAGQTQHAAGLLALSVKSGIILGVASLYTVKTVAGSRFHQIVTNAIVDNQVGQTNRCSFSISADGKDFYWIDQATNAALRVAANDYMMVGLIIGSEGSTAYMPHLLRP